MVQLSLVQIAGMAMDDLAAAALRGELGLPQLWCACKGAARYTRALAAGDVAGERDQAGRVRCCAQCPNVTRHEFALGVKLYCGTPFDDSPAALAEGKCGCLLGVEVDGVLIPGAKTAVASEACLDGRWGAVERALVR